jgi:3-dehydroquinate dehydratase-2
VPSCLSTLAACPEVPRLHSSAPPEAGSGPGLLTRPVLRATVMPNLDTRPLVAVLNGPNINMLGLRQPHIYGRATLDDVEALCAEAAELAGLAIDFRQTNGEGELITWVQECRGRAAGIVINPAGYTTTSVALLDALLATELPVIEVHITNIHRREAFRQESYVSRAAVGVICGLGVRGYAMALQAMADLLEENR